jgi:hypothetical protein
MSVHFGNRVFQQNRSKAAIHRAIWTNFVRPGAPALIETADLLHLKCSAISAINSAFAFPSTGGDFNFATHVPSAACVSDETRARGVTLT